MSIDFENLLSNREKTEDDLLNEMQIFYDESPSWHHFHSTETFQMAMDWNAPEIRLYVEAILPVEPERFTQYHRMQLELDRPKWSKSCSKSDVLNVFGDVSFHNVVEHPRWPYSPRDFYFMRSYRQTDDGCVVLSRSIPDVPEVKGHVRAKVLFGSQSVEPYADDESKSLVRMCLHRVNDFKLPKHFLASQMSGIITKNVSVWAELANDFK